MLEGSCPAQQTLSDFLLGKSDETTEETLLSHLRGCAACRETLCVAEAEGDTFVSTIKRGSDAAEFENEPQLEQVLLRLRDSGSADSAEDQTLITDEIAIRGQQLGQYRLLSLLGKGGMGTVYKATHTRLEMTVAVKVLASRLTNDPRAVARFDREMKAVGSISHPNIVRATDAGEQGGQHYLAMEFVDGSDLGHLLRKHGPLPLSDACEVVRQAAIGMHHAHTHDLIHRDLKPSNLMLTHDGQVKVLDLGLARLRNLPQHEGLTDDFQMMGTADYMAPEQATKAATADAKSDIYSLGCTLYALLCGRPPFGEHAAPLKKLMAHECEQPPPVRSLRPEVPEELAGIIGTALAKSPDQRFASAQEFAEQLEPFAIEADLCAFIEGGRSPSPLAPVAGHNDRKTRFAWRAIISLGVAVVALALVLKFQTVDGTIIVEISGNKISTETIGEELVITDRNSDSVYRLSIQQSKTTQKLKPGEYTIAVANAASGLKLTTNEFQVHRDEKVIINAWLEPQGVVSDHVPTVTESVDRSVAIWILANGGDMEIVHSGVHRPITKVSHLPDDDFVIYRMRLHHPAPFTPEHFPELLKLEHLVDVNLRHVDLTDELIRQLAQFARVEILQLEARTVSTTRLDALGNMPRLHSLALEGPGINDEIVRQAAMLTNVESLTFVGGNLTGDCVTHLKNVRQLISLRFDACNLRNLKLRQLGSLGSLSQLSLPFSTVTDDFLTSVEELVHVEHLELNATRISDHCLRHIATMPSVKVVLLSGTKITTAGVAQLRAAPTITTLDLRETQIDDGAVDHLAELTALKLVRVGSRLSQTAVAELQSRLPECKIEWTQGEANVTHSSPLDQRQVNEWALQQDAILHLHDGRRSVVMTRSDEFPEGRFHTKAIHFTRPIALQDPDFAFLQSLPWMTQLTLTDLVLTDQIVEHLLNLPSLTTLKLEYETTPPQGLEHLSRLTNLRHFGIGGALVGDEHIPSIIGMNTVFGLTVGGRKVTDASLAEIARMKRIDFLSLNFAQVTGSGLKDLQSMPDLFGLHLPYTPITDEGLQEISRLRALRWLNLDMTSVGDDCIPYVVSLPDLERLELSETQVTDRGVGLLRPVLTLRHLTLNNSRVTDAAVDDLAAMTQLTQLAVDKCLSAAAFAELRERLPQCHVIGEP